MVLTVSSALFPVTRRCCHRRRGLLRDLAPALGRLVPAFRSSRVIAATSVANFGKQRALETLNSPVPLSIWSSCRRFAAASAGTSNRRHWNHTASPSAVASLVERHHPRPLHPASRSWRRVRPSKWVGMTGR